MDDFDRDAGQEPAVNARKSRRAGRRRRRSLGKKARRLGSSLRLGLLAAFMRFSRGLRSTAHYVHAGCVGAVRSAAEFLRENALLRQLVGDVRHLILTIAFIAAVIALVVETVYIVDFNSSAIVLRLGRYHRTVDSGIRFKLPLVEKVFVVNTKSRLQEDFGFIQYTPPPKPLTEFEQEVAAHQADTVVEVAEAEIEARDSGNLQQELERGPPLPRDYVIARNPPSPREPDPQAEAEEVMERIDLQAEALKNVVPPDGKVPVPEDMKMLTGDLNIVYVTWSVQYEILSGRDYLFRATDVQRVLRDVSMIAMRIAVGDRLDYEILSTGRREIEREARILIQEIVDRYPLGLDIVAVIIQDANPPDQVKASFHQVNRAKQQMENIVHQAEAEYNSIIPQTYGKAERILAEAKAYAIELKNRAIGEAARFDVIREQYRKSPEVIRDRYYIEAMEDVYARTAVTLIDPKLKGILPLFQGQRSSVDPLPPEMAAVIGAPEPLQHEIAPAQSQARAKHIPETGAHTPPQRSVDPPGALEGVHQSSPVAPEAAPAVNRVEPVKLPAGGNRRAP